MTQTFPNCSSIEVIQLIINDIPPLINGKAWVKALAFTPTEIKFTYQVQPNSRILEAVDPEKLLIADFRNLYFEDQQHSSTYITKILTEGILINEKRYNYLGQSNNQMKQHKCLLLQAEHQEIQQFLNKFGDWSSFTSVSKLSKRIGLLFSTGEKVFDLPSENYKVIDDVERNGLCFTDGCGLASKAIIIEVVKKMNLKFREKRYPSVIQIRYQGFKGILLYEKDLRGMTCHFRKSMHKFTCNGPNDFYVVDYSKPYTFGRLNTQIVMLLSSLGVPDDAFLHKQVQYFSRLDSMFTELSIALEDILNAENVALACDLIENGFTEKVLQYVNKLYKHEMGTSLKVKKGRLGAVESEKLRILVKDSRIAFVASDPTNKLQKNQCFFRPTIRNQPKTIVGPIFCVRNPCYHPGDILVLQAVNLPECEQIVDVLLFSLNGEVPAAHRSAGGDLDGDKFFVCWDPELMPRETVESYDYPGHEEIACQNIERTDLIRNFASYSNVGIAQCVELFMKWADAKGPRCEECVQINELFSHAVDGQPVKIPDFLALPPEVDIQVRKDRIWNKLVTIAEERRASKLANKTNLAIQAEDPQKNMNN
ncbi:5813_t:CDS:1 [Funneliformis caledonium]|uniref:RNA-dependent RNA polymerase n=1 Tax=Funneliformis caledonium TaxID=1117310 RepID=A0A9N9GUS1_9GLOM|nr:5813_t:CDS:1 [Funneliformis caledonium]